jgi:hypothetical protein
MKNISMSRVLNQKHRFWPCSILDFSSSRGEFFWPAIHGLLILREHLDRADSVEKWFEEKSSRFDSRAEPVKEELCGRSSGKESLRVKTP